MTVCVPLNLVVAASDVNGIGINGNLPWTLKTDMKFFAQLTTELHLHPKEDENVVIMGRKTWESIPSKFRPLKNRTNVVLSRNKDFIRDLRGALGFTSLDDAMNHFKTINQLDRQFFVIGGCSVYQEALSSVHFSRLFLTRVSRDDGSSVECDTFFPQLDLSTVSPVDLSEFLKNLNLSNVLPKINKENGYSMQFLLYENHHE